MGFNQVHCMDTLAAATGAGADRGEFIYAFLDAYGFARSTITQVRNGSARNVAERKNEGHVALKNQLYFMPVRTGESVHEAIQTLADDERVARHKPRFRVVTDFKEITAVDRKTDERIECDFGDLPGQYLFFAPMAGLERAGYFNEESADVKAAAKMGKLFERLREHNAFDTPEQLHALYVFLTRLLFCYFAEDTGIFEKDVFTRVIAEASEDDGTGLTELLADLFRVLNQPEADRVPNTPTHLAGFPYVNGGLFAHDLPVPAIGAKARRMMIECGQLEWSQTNPDIFGSMFQAVLDEESRDAFGQHYTSVPNILKVIRTLFLDKLASQLELARGNRKRLQALLLRLWKIRCFDPAMGSGNFLIIAYKELRRLEMEVFRALGEVSNGNEMVLSGIHLGQFYGIEINDFARETAMLSLWLAEHQMNTLFKKEFGNTNPTLPLTESGHLVLGNSLRLDWNDVCPQSDDAEIYVCGNPPFRGATYRSAEQNEDMDSVFEGFKKHRYLDYVACFVWKGAQYIADGGADLAFVSTNSICQGEQVAMLWPSVLERGIEIAFAYQTFSWKNSAQGNAGVHVVIIGLSAQAKDKRLFKWVDDEWRIQNVANISPYLVTGTDTVVPSRNKPLVGSTAMVYGNKPVDGGHLMMSTEEMKMLVAAEPAAGWWIRRLMGAEEFIKGKERWCLWMAEATERDFDSMPLVRERVERVRSMRLASKKAATNKIAGTPNLFGQIRHPKSEAYILVPRVTSERRRYAPIGFFDSDVIANDAVQIIPYGTYYDFAILSTQMHMDWLRLVGGRLKSDYRYSAKLVYNTFPWPDATASQRRAIEKLGQKVLLARENHPAKTMADLYDPDKMPADLRAVHRRLDEAVDALYRDRPFRDTAERQEYLLARYAALIEAEKAGKAKRVEMPRRMPARSPVYADLRHG